MARRHLRAARRVRRADAHQLDQPGGLQGGAGGDAGQVPRGPAHVRARVRPVLLPRRRGRGGPPGDLRGADAGQSGRVARARPRRAAPADRRGAARRVARRRCATWRGWRSPRSAAARARACSASTCSGSAARSACAPSPSPTCPTTIRAATASPATSCGGSSSTCGASWSAALIERTASLPPKRPLTELDRALPTGPIQDLAAVHRVVAQLKRRLATQGHELKGRKRHAHVDVRRTMRASLQTGGVPVELKYRPRRPRRPGDLRAVRRLDERHQRQHVLPQRAARAARLVPQAALVRVHRADLRGHRGVRARARLPRRLARPCRGTPASPTSRATPTTGACGPSSWRMIEDELHPRATVIVLGDARTNGRPPRDDVFAADHRQGRPDVLAQPRAQAVLELRRLGDRRLRRALHRRSSAGGPISSRSSSRR